MHAEPRGRWGHAVWPGCVPSTRTPVRPRGPSRPVTVDQGPSVPLGPGVSARHLWGPSLCRPTARCSPMAGGRTASPVRETQSGHGEGRAGEGLAEPAALQSQRWASPPRPVPPSLRAARPREGVRVAWGMRVRPQLGARDRDVRRPRLSRARGSRHACCAPPGHCPNLSAAVLMRGAVTLGPVPRPRLSLATGWGFADHSGAMGPRVCSFLRRWHRPPQGAIRLWDTGARRCSGHLGASVPPGPSGGPWPGSAVREGDSPALSSHVGPTRRCHDSPGGARLQDCPWHGPLGCLPRLPAARETVCKCFAHRRPPRCLWSISGCVTPRHRGPSKREL